MTRHSDIRETLRRVKEVVFWNSIIKDTIRYVRECLLCQKERPNRKLGIGQEIDRSNEVWKGVLIDYIIKLPRSREKDSILVIKNQYSGMIHLKTMKEV